MIPNGFLDLLLESNISMAIVASSNHGSIEVVNGKKSLVSDDLVNHLFGDADTVIALSRSLEGQKLPRLWAQGDQVFCMVCKPSNDRIVGLFYQDKKNNPKEEIRWSKEINRRIEELWKK